MHREQEQDVSAPTRNVFCKPPMYRKRSVEMMGALYEDVEKFFGDIFAHYARVVVRYPVPFVVVPLIVCALLGLGLIRFTYETSVQKLYTPMDGRSLSDQVVLAKLFPDKSGDDFYGHQQVISGPQGEVIISCKGDTEECAGDILTPTALEEVLHLYDYILHNVTLNNGAISFKDVCAIRNCSCVVAGEKVLEMRRTQPECPNNFTDVYKISHSDPIQNIDNILSSINEQPNGCLNATAIRLLFYLRSNTTDEIAISHKWEHELVNTLKKLSFKIIKINFKVSQSLDKDINDVTNKDTQLFLYSILLMMLYATVIGAGGNWVSNHVSLALAGVFAGLLSILASCGFLSLCGMPFVNMSGLMPFLIIGIGTDDMFHLMTEWRQTSIRDSIDSRLTITMRSAAVSITITSLADILAFCIGATSPFVSVKNFCALSGVAIFFCYFNQMTFFSGYLVLHAKRIKQARHCITCIPVRPREQLEHNGSHVCCVLMCSGHPPRKSSDEGGICRLFSSACYSIYPRILLHWFTKCFVIALFGVYIGLSVWGVTQVKKGFPFEQIVSQESQLAKFFAEKSNYFPATGPTVMFAITRPVEYHQPATLKSVSDVLQNAQHLPHILDSPTISWLQDFTKFMVINNRSSIRSEKQFIQILKERFLPQHKQYYNDIHFNDDNSAIDASRFYVFSKGLDSTLKEADLLLESRRVANSSPIPMVTYSQEFIYYEHYASILKDTLLVVGVTMIGLLFVALVFIPHPIAVSCVTISMCSVALGMVAFMAFCNLELSAVTTVQIILSVAFCTDSTVHVSHAFMTARGKNRNERVTVAIERVGTPILNGCVSSILGIGVLLFSDSYIFMCFCKSMFIVVVLVLLHSLVFLPVLLSFIGPRRTSKPRVFIPVSNSARSLQDTYRTNSLTRPTDKDIEQFRVERLAKLQLLTNCEESPKLTRSHSAVELETPLDTVSIAKVTPINIRRVSFAGDNSHLSFDCAFMRKCGGASPNVIRQLSEISQDMATLLENSDEDRESSGVKTESRASSQEPIALFTIGPQT